MQVPNGESSEHAAGHMNPSKVCNTILNHKYKKGNYINTDWKKGLLCELNVVELDYCYNKYQASYQRTMHCNQALQYDPTLVQMFKLSK